MENVDFSTLCIRYQNGHGFNSHGDAVTVRHSRGTLSMREMSLYNWFASASITVAARGLKEGF